MGDRHVPREAIEALVKAEHGSPRDVLGMVEADGGVVVRTFQPRAHTVELIDEKKGRAFPMDRIHDGGFYEVFIPGEKCFPYRLKMRAEESEWELKDPYSFPLQITDFDLYLFGEGSNYRTYLKMGAHPMTLDGTRGVFFAVWAPNAKRVSVVGAFNQWDGRRYPMQKRGGSGLWELFIPAMQPGDLYKFEVLSQNGYMMDKTDPYGFAAEVRPNTASVVWNNHGYTWNDKAWMDARPKINWLEKPINVYELHAGSWRRNPDEGNRWLTYRELAAELIPYVKDLGFTHIELLPITEHPFDGSWGYQTIGYFAPTARFGSPDDLKFFIDQCHQQGLSVILDWVPAHFPKDGHGLNYFDGTHLYEHADPRQGEHKDWGTLIFNYGRNEVCDFLLSSAMFWADIYHIDGLRVDAVASMLYLDYSREHGQWIPNKYGGNENLEAIEFIKKFNEIIHQEYPGFLTYAEESTSWPMVSRPVYLGGLGFDLKWNMGWMHDILTYMEKEAVHRKFHHHELTFSLHYAWTENFILPFSHDEVVYGKGSMIEKMPGDLWQKFANLRLLYAYMYAHPGKKLLFMGCEFGQWSEWNYQDSLQWHLLDEPRHQSMQSCLKTLNRYVIERPEMHEIDFTPEGFEWIDLHDIQQSIVSFIRRGKNRNDYTVCAFNFTPVPRENYRVGVPGPGMYREVLNTDDAIYGGSNITNPIAMWADHEPWGSQKYSVKLTMPPLGAVYIRAVERDPDPSDRPGPTPPTASPSEESGD
ncbi:MAG: 1,4-alpha-glucan branching protein GlgB [Spartobacteria bacterium]|nr:1,4-alpha-glucan branching protein GlgB [Spartobacteria bacterium]